MKLFLIMPPLDRHERRVHIPHQHRALDYFPSFDGIFGRGRFIKDISGRSVAQKQEVLIHPFLLLLELPFVHRLKNRTAATAFWTTERLVLHEAAVEPAPLQLSNNDAGP